MSNTGFEQWRSLVPSALVRRASGSLAPWFDGLRYSGPMCAWIADSYRRVMRIPALILSTCVAAVLLAACTTNAVESASAPTVPAEKADALRGDLEALIRDGAVGALATLTDNSSTAVLTAGVADIAAGTPIPDDRPQYVRVGSITKSFTAAIVLQLVDEHRIDLDEPVDTYLPGLLTGDHVDGREITVRQILGHRSGLTDPARTRETHEHAAAQDGRTYTPAEEVALALRSPAKFAPGARFEYANINSSSPAC